MNAPANPIDIAYLVTSVMFILGLKYLSSPATARLGNRVAGVGMAIALIATLCNSSIYHKSVDIATTIGQFHFSGGFTFPTIIIIGVIIGGLIGFFSAQSVKMTAMPQMVALFNGAGGGAAALVATAEFLRATHPTTNGVIVRAFAFLHPTGPTSTDLITMLLTTVIGSLSIAGSVVAFLKLQELMTGRPITYPGQKVVNGLILLVIIGAAACVVSGFHPLLAFAITGLFALVLGVCFVLPIGGADMPVVISLLNAFTGVAAAATGFVLGNNVLIISGALVGASGTLLTILMGQAMNRPISNVLFGAFGSGAGSGPAASSTGDANIRSASVDDVATMLSYAQQVIIVPGYGMAVAQAQHAVRNLEKELEARGVTVKYAIHPVAGRMPGHMNVLLAEADVPYTALYDMEDINPEFAHTDVALVIGANDVTNPSARNDKSSPIYGMPILDVDQAQNIVVLKRSMRSGFAGIPNPLYEDPKTVMLFGDAKDSVEKLASAVKTL
jgi:NAD(P) transhydrogenase subunit beta